MAWNEPGGNKDDDKKRAMTLRAQEEKPPDLEQSISNFFNKLKSIFEWWKLFINTK